ncbi:MAG: MlaE family ABC transporter permease [Bacteroidota bacterium]|jgi:phospholipid/cholesterol/gamma-HCH transport system permease protein
MAGVLESFGKYALLMRRVFSRPEKKRVYYPLITEEMMKIGVQSVGIVALLAFFMGAVVALQTASNIESGWIPKWTVGYTTKQTMIYEFSSTIVALVLAGKVGSNIASEIGTMRISEQIDALDIMGVNSASYLILPKLIAALFILPFLVLMAMFIGIGAGALIAVLTNIVSLTDFIYGIQYDFQIYGVIYSLIKTLFFAFILTTIPAFHGYYAHGGALEVGKSSTKGVVYSMVAVMVANYILTQLLLL